MRLTIETDSVRRMNGEYVVTFNDNPIEDYSIVRIKQFKSVLQEALKEIEKYV